MTKKQGGGGGKDKKGPNVWVGPNPRGPGWQVKPEGEKKPMAVVPTKEKAKEIGRKEAQENGSELVVQGGDGRIQDKDSHGRESPKKDKDGHKK